MLLLVSHRAPAEHSESSHVCCRNCNRSAHNIAAEKQKVETGGHSPEAVVSALAVAEAPALGRPLGKAEAGNSTASICAQGH